MDRDSPKLEFIWIFPLYKGRFSRPSGYSNSKLVAGQQLHGVSLMSILI